MILYHSGHLGSRKNPPQHLFPEMDVPQETASVLLRGRARLLTFADFVAGHLSEEMLPTLVKMHPNLALDSGAFSVAQGTVDISVHDYSEFLYRCSSYFDFVTNLDVTKRQHELLQLDVAAGD